MNTLVNLSLSLTHPGSSSELVAWPRSPDLLIRKTGVSCKVFGKQFLAQSSLSTSVLFCDCPVKDKVENIKNLSLRLPLEKYLILSSSKNQNSSMLAPVREQERAGPRGGASGQGLSH